MLVEIAIHKKWECEDRYKIDKLAVLIHQALDTKDVNTMMVRGHSKMTFLLTQTHANLLNYDIQTSLRYLYMFLPKMIH
jgi:hypothetical protein